MGSVARRREGKEADRLPAGSPVAGSPETERRTAEGGPAGDRAAEGRFGAVGVRWPWGAATGNFVTAGGNPAGSCRRRGWEGGGIVGGWNDRRWRGQGVRHERAARGQMHGGADRFRTGGHGRAEEVNRRGGGGSHGQRLQGGLPALVVGRGETVGVVGGGRSVAGSDGWRRRRSDGGRKRGRGRLEGFLWRPAGGLGRPVGWV